MSITTDIQDMLGSHHRLDMGSSWREQRVLGEKINKGFEMENESKDVLEYKNNSATTHIRKWSQQEAGKRSNMKKKQEISSKDDQSFTKMDYKDGKVVLKSKTEVFICPICGSCFNQLMFFLDHNKTKHGDQKVLEDFSYCTFGAFKIF